MEPDDPPPKAYGFKEREFRRENVRASGAAPMPTARELAMMAGPVVHSPKGAAGPKAGDPNDVFAALQKNRAVEKQHGLNEVELREIKSRRLRDFWLHLFGGNLAIVAGVALSGFNIISVIFGLSGLIVFSLGVTWVMWQVMNKY